MRIAVVTSIPTPYRDPFWSVFAAQENVELEVIYCSPGKGDRPWDRSWRQDYVTHYPRAYNLARYFGEDASCYWNPKIGKILSAQPFDGIIVGGYNHLTMLRAILFARRHGIPYFLQSEVYLAQPRSSWRVWAKQALVTNIVTRAAGCLPTGKLASEYLLHYGADPDAMCQIPNVPDVEQLHKTATALLPRREEIKAEKGVAGKYVVLFVSRLIELKRVDLLLRAFAVASEGMDAVLVILGDGPMRQEWEQLAGELKLGDRVRFEGFLNPEALPEWYSIADLSALTSTDETWSVVVLEALAAGVPVVITDRVGCYANAINDERVGDVVRAGDLTELTAALKKRMTAKPQAGEIARAWAPGRESFRYQTIAERAVAFLAKHCNQARSA